MPKTLTIPTPTLAPTPTDVTDLPGCAGSSNRSALRMLDQYHGWATTSDTILKTDDGGLHWSCVGPAQTPPGPIAKSEFLDDQTAWISMIKMSVGVVILHTTDGGLHWQTTTIDGMPAIQAGTPQLDFINSQLGWFEVAPNGPYPSGEVVDIYHTNDGGVTWIKIASSTDANSGLPGLGFKSGLSFEDALNGWATGNQVLNTPWLYVTHDGGKTWTPQQLPNLPVSQDSRTNVNSYETKPPVFFGRNGLLPVQIVGGTITDSLLLYTTNDGGQNWNTTYLTNHAALEKSAIDVNTDSLYIGDMQNAWVGNPWDDALYGTSDGGQSWHKIAAGMGESLLIMSFINAEDGWGFTTNHSLVKTTDGGQTFQIIHCIYAL